MSRFVIKGAKKMVDWRNSERKVGLVISRHHHHLHYLLLLVDQLEFHSACERTYPPPHPNHRLLHHCRNNSHRNPDDPLILRRHRSRSRHLRTLQTTDISLLQMTCSQRGWDVTYKLFLLVITLLQFSPFSGFLLFRPSLSFKVFFP